MKISKGKLVPKEFKGVIHVWRVPLYGIHIYYSCDDRALFKFKGKEENQDNYAGLCFLGKDDICIYVRRNKGDIELPTMAHEIFHAAMHIAELVGLRPKTYSNESVAYIITWITHWVLQCAKKDKKRLSD